MRVLRASGTAFLGDLLELFANTPESPIVLDLRGILPVSAKQGFGFSDGFGFGEVLSHVCSSVVVFAFDGFSIRHLKTESTYFFIAIFY